jgi:hypothetical protein
MGGMGKLKNSYRILVEKLKAKRTLEVPRNRYEDNIEVNLKGQGFDGVGWIYLAYDMNQ